MPSNNTSPMFFYTYILQSENDLEQYVGYTTDLRKRLEEHRMGRVFSTKGRLPLALVYYEACTESADAKQREKYLKITASRRFLAKRLRSFRAKAAWRQAK